MPLSREKSFPVANFPAVRNRPPCSCGCVQLVTTACIVANVIYLLALFVCSTPADSDHRQVPSQCSSFLSFQIQSYTKHSHRFVSSKFDSYAHRALPFDSSVFHSPEEAFRLNYEQMEEEFKVFVYPDGDPKTYFHTPRKLTGKYASEAYFFKNIRESRFVTDDPRRAHLFFLPISCHKMRGRGLNNERMIDEVEKYVEYLKFKYPYWNKTLGADHFFVTCHDIGVKATKGDPYLMKNSIRVVCSSSYDDDDYIPHKDVTLPQVQLPFFHPPGGNDFKNRNTLAFWAGRSDSRLKDVLIAMWDNDTELDIQSNRIDFQATGHVVFMEKLYKSKFCLCPHGPIGSSRIADSIHFGCVPVIMSNYYDLPFNDILDWRKFSVILKETDVYLLKDILRSISEKHFTILNKNLVKIQKHFKWNTPPVRQDAFHMVMYDLWLRRHLIRY